MYSVVFGSFLLFSVQLLTYCNVFCTFFVVFGTITMFSVVFCTFLLFSVQLLTYCNVFCTFLLFWYSYCDVFGSFRYFSVVFGTVIDLL